MAIQVTCHHCGEKQLYTGGVHYKNCRKCGYKIFIKDDNTAVDPYTLNQGLGTLNVEYTTKRDHINIVPWGDVHVGAPEGQCDWEKAQRELKYVLDTPDTYLIGMGDLMDCAQKMTGRGPNLFASSLMPMEQLELIESALKPLARKGKIIGLLGGNHEEWIMQNSGIQIMDILCQRLKVPYLGLACNLNMKVNNIEYILYAMHGSGNAQLKHTKIGRLMNSTKDIFADVLMMGHVHQIAVAKGGKYQKGTTHKTYYVTTGHFLNWVGSYAQAFGMDVSPSGTVKIQFYTNRKDVHVSA